MTLSKLLAEIRNEYDKSYQQLKMYEHIPEVNNFLKRRSADLKEFEVLVSKYPLSMDVFNVQQYLRQQGVSHKFYGGICMNGAQYFKVTKKVKKLVEEAQILETLEENNNNYDKEFNYDSSFAIPDELNEEEFQLIFTEE